MHKSTYVILLLGASTIAHADDPCSDFSNIVQSWAKQFVCAGPCVQELRIRDLHGNADQKVNGATVDLSQTTVGVQIGFGPMGQLIGRRLDLPAEQLPPRAYDISLHGDIIGTRPRTGIHLHFLTGKISCDYIMWVNGSSVQSAKLDPPSTPRDMLSKVLSASANEGVPQSRSPGPRQQQQSQASIAGTWHSDSQGTFRFDANGGMEHLGDNAYSGKYRIVDTSHIRIDGLSCEPSCRFVLQGNVMTVFFAAGNRLTFTRQNGNLTTQPTSVNWSGPSALTRDNVQRAVDQMLAGVRRGGSVVVQGVQNTQDGAEADIRFDSFQYHFNSAAFMGVQRFAGMGKAVIAHYNDSRWVLTQVIWNFGDYVSGEIEVTRDSGFSRPAQPASVSKDKVQRAVDQLLSGVSRGGTALVQGIKEGAGGAEADVLFNNFQYYFSSTPFMGVRRFSGMGTAAIAHYTDGRWVLTRVIWNFGDYVSGNVEIR